MQQNVDENAVLDVISKIKKKTEKLNSQLEFCVEHYKDYQNTGSVFEKDRTSNGLVEATKTSEKITVMLREVPFSIGFSENKFDICEGVQNAFSAVFGYTENGFFYMKIPRIPTVKSDPSNVKYFRDSVYTILSNAFVTGTLQRYTFGKVVLVYRNRYAPDVTIKRWSDNDNFEHRALTNLLSAFFLYDDNPEYCDNYFCSDPGTENCTEVYIIPKEKYVEFLKLKDNGSLESVKPVSKMPL